MQLLRAIF